MPFAENLLQAIIVIIGLIGLVQYLRHVGLLLREHAGLFARLVTEVTLPALIFVSLAKHHLIWREALLPFLMMGAELVCLALAWVVASLLQLSRPQKGAFILASGFGTSALLGYVIVQQVFPLKPEALTDAVFISEIGVGLLIFTLGVFIARYYGAAGDTRVGAGAETIRFFYSPIFFSLVSGVTAASIPGATVNPVFAVLYKFLHILAQANTWLVIITIGLLLNFRNLGAVVPLVLLAGVIKLIVQPVLVFLPTGWLNIPDLWRQVLVLEAAMPAATLSAVFAQRYGCDAGLASLLIFSSVVLSAFTVLGVLMAL
jgi:predicted permease